MTVKERFERIEYVTETLVEERGDNHAEFRQLWRDTQQINELRARIEQCSEVGERLEKRIEQPAEESREAGWRLGGRIDARGEHIDALVAAIGKPIENRGA